MYWAHPLYLSRSYMQLSPENLTSVRFPITDELALATPSCVFWEKELLVVKVFKANRNLLVECIKIFIMKYLTKKSTNKE